MEIQEKIKKNINIAIKQSGKTKREICKNANINYCLLTQYQSVQNRKIPAEWVFKIARSTGVTSDFIFGE